MHIMDRMLPLRALAALLLLGLATPPGPGRTDAVTLRVVDQNGQELTGSKVSLVGGELSWETPATANLDFGPHCSRSSRRSRARCSRTAGIARRAERLARDEFLFVDGSPELVIVWNTAQVALDTQFPGGTWGFEGEGTWYGPATVTAPITDEASTTPCRVLRATAGASPSARPSTARRSTSPAPRRARWTVRPRACPSNGANRRATWAWSMARGRRFVAPRGPCSATRSPPATPSLFPPPTTRRTAARSRRAFPRRSSPTPLPVRATPTFEVNADGSLAPAFVTINGGSFGLRCGVAPFPPVTTGTLNGTVLATASRRPGVSVTPARFRQRHARAGHRRGRRLAFTDVPAGPATVTIKVPSGYHALKPVTGQVTTSVTRAP
jgi:hypothetical protein